MDSPFQLGDWLVEPALNRLSGEEGSVQLEPRAMDLLVFFACHPGEVLSRETLIDGVWQKQFVGEAVLRNTVAALRRALGDRADSPQYIETISKRGYRLIAPMTGSVARPAQPSPGDTRMMLSWEGTEIPLVAGDNLIGRDESAAVRIDSPEVSRRHARLSVVGDSATIEDLGSKNGTFRNGRRLEAPERLDDGDEIWIGLNLASLHFKVCDDRTKTQR